VARFHPKLSASELNICIVGSAIEGSKGVQKATQLQPDLVVLNVGLPGLSGIEAAQQIRKGAPNCAILFLSEVLIAMS
jgi:DNA-binding NarL/FixJ family response regulator